MRGEVGHDQRLAEAIAEGLLLGRSEMLTGEDEHEWSRKASWTAANVSSSSGLVEVDPGDRGSDRR